MSNAISSVNANGLGNELMRGEFKQASNGGKISSEAGDFGGLLKTAVEKVGEMQSSAEQKVSGLLAGDGTDVHTAALAVEKASLGFELMMQVRNKMVSAYQEVSRLQF